MGLVAVKGINSLGAGQMTPKRAVSFKIEAAGISDRGRIRANNEDFLLVDPQAGIYAIADGVGGHASGEIASRLAVQAVQQYLRALAQKYPAPTAQQGTVLVKAAVEYASKVVFQKSLEAPEHRNMATTLDLVWVVAGHAFVAHVGDSRVYLWRNGRLELYTEDHHQGHLAVRNKQIREDEVESFLKAQPHLKNAIWQAVGLSPQVFPDAFSIGLMPGDVLLLCSDGLTKHLSDPEIAGMLGAPAADLASRVEAIIAEANRRGGTDNVSVVLVQVRESALLENEPTLGGWISPMIRLEGISKVSFFSSLTQAQRERVSGYATYRSAGAGETLMKQGDPAEELWVLLSGAVDVLVDGKLAANRKAPYIIGERSLFEHAQRAATVLVREPIAALVFNRQGLGELERDHPLIALKIKDAIIADLLLSRARPS